jgi:type IV pilus assembly protein PilY1
VILGGQVWRIDLNNSKGVGDTLRIKTPTKILNLNNGAYSPRFYEMPAFSTYSLSGTIFAVLSVGSGNRSQPLAGYSTDSTVYEHDGVYNIYDKDVAGSNLFNFTSRSKPSYTSAALNN